MKKAIYLLSALVLTFIVILSCNKNQKVVKELDGTWKVTSATTNGVPDSSFLGATYTFTKCKVKKKDCDGTASNLGFTFPFKYNVTGKGEKFSITYNLGTSSQTYNGTITEHSKSKMVFTGVEDGDTVVLTMTK